MTPSASGSPLFLTSRSDYHSLVLFRHIRQHLAAVQSQAVEDFYASAASKPGDEFHYMGLLWDCAFKAGIESTRAHSGPPSCPPIAAAALSSPKILPTPIRDFSALQSSTSKPFGSLRRRFRRRLRVLTSPQAVFPQAKKDSASKTPLPSCSSIISPQILHPVPISSPQPPQICNHPSQLPLVNPVSGSPPNESPSSISPSNRSSFIRRFRLRPRLPHWIRPPST